MDFKLNEMQVKNQKEFHRIVCSRDNFQCQVCKKSFNYGYCFDDNGEMFV